MGWSFSRKFRAKPTLEPALTSGGLCPMVDAGTRSSGGAALAFGRRNGWPTMYRSSKSDSLLGPDCPTGDPPVRVAGTICLGAMSFRIEGGKRNSPALTRMPPLALVLIGGHHRLELDLTFSGPVPVRQDVASLVLGHHRAQECRAARLKVTAP